MYFIIYTYFYFFLFFLFTHILFYCTYIWKKDFPNFFSLSNSLIQRHRHAFPTWSSGSRPPQAFPTIVTAPPLSPRANTRTTPLSAPCSKQGLTVNHDSLKCVLEFLACRVSSQASSSQKNSSSNIDQTLEQENLLMTPHASFDILQERERGRNFSLQSCNHFNLIQQWCFEFRERKLKYLRNFLWSYKNRFMIGYSTYNVLFYR